MVRNSYSARRHALAAAVVFSLTAGTLTVQAAQAAQSTPDGRSAQDARSTRSDDLKDRKKKVQRNIKSAKSHLEESSAVARKANARLSVARKKLSTARSKLARTQSQLSAARELDQKMAAELTSAKQDLVAARQALAAAKAKVREQRADVARLGAENVHRATPQLMGISSMLRAQTPQQVTNQMKAVSNVMARQDQILDDFRTARAKVAAEERREKRAKDQVQAKRKAAAEQLALQRRLERDAAAQEKSVSGLVGERRSAQADAERARRSDQAELRKLRAENNRISGMLAARARKAVDQGNDRRARSGGGGGAGGGGGPLARPVNGPVTSPFGYRTHPIYGYYSLHDGTDFAAGCGTPLRAAGNGTVVQEYFQSAWGNRLILDVGRVRGRGVSVIYNHLSGYRVRPGAKVRRGDVVGYVGTTGWSTGCHLHYTVMVDGKPANPMNWM